MSPFEMLYGHPPRHFGIMDASATAPQNLTTWLEERTLVIALLKQHLERARQRMKAQADQHRSERSFAEGDWVFVKIQPYVQVSVAERANHKLSFCYFGPFQVVARVGAVAYRLRLPESSKVHPVFHLSLLRRALPPDTEAQPELPTIPLPYSPPALPEQVLARRVVTRGAAKIPQVFVKWPGQPASLASWEDYFEMRSRFQELRLGDKPPLKRGRTLRALKLHKRSSPAQQDPRGGSGPTSASTRATWELGR